ncbi:MAG TPA: amylo-alpha-1,6-glucosidase [Verrucomicrobiae bacterium]|nr:amylo-alpha-1,6-glucosidase [Verrucomicrobiae bacterium]
MSDIIEVQGHYYIRANASIADTGARILKHADTFAVFDRHGDIRPLGFENQGIFHEGTRFLSRWKLLVNGASPLLLSSNVREDNDFLIVDLTNPPLPFPDAPTVQQGTIHFVRTIFLLDNNCFERTEISNFGLDPVSLIIGLEFRADYVDLFEIRGNTRTKSGIQRPPRVSPDEVILSYDGLDSVHRQTRIRFSLTPDKITRERAIFEMQLKPREQKILDCRIVYVAGERKVRDYTFDSAFDVVHVAYEHYREDLAVIETSNPQFNEWVVRSRADLHLLLTETPAGPYPYAGIPWFSCIFGRDGIITALEMLWLQPNIARAVLGHLASRQATELDPAKDAEPGKILHEDRKGEMVSRGEVPFGSYYGSIDSTPLWVLLAGHYFERTADKEFIGRLWPNIERALEWIDKYGDSDGDGFLEYRRRASGGLSNQGWKDAEDSVFHADGTLVRPPIALCEVQGYVYEAKLKAARLAEVLGHSDRAGQLRQAAQRLKERFHEAFWCEEIGSYAIALDGNKKPCCVRASNAGQCLFTGIAHPEAAAKIKDSLMKEAFFSGWGVRTIASSEARYNPMSYHNGSIWPHDNALIACGLARYGFKEAATRVLSALFDASQFMELDRLPELFCGFERRDGEGPTLYPVACNPQAWSSAAVFFVLQAVLGARIEAAAHRLYFDNPHLPDSVQRLEIKNLRVNSSIADISLIRHDGKVAVNVPRRDGKMEIIVTH